MNTRKNLDEDNAAPTNRYEPLQHFGKPLSGWRKELFIIIFEAETTAGKCFDFALIAAIVMSAMVVMLDSIAPVGARYGEILGVLEWVFTIVFTLEYLARLVCVNHPVRKSVV